MANENSNRFYEQLYALLPIITHDIKTAKKQQWHIVYYVLLIFAAVISINEFSNGDHSFIRYFLVVSAFLIHLLGTYHLLNTQRDICIYRMRLLSLFCYLDDDAKKIFKFDESLKENDGEPYIKYSRYFWNLILNFYLLQLVGLIVILFLTIEDPIIWVFITIFTSIIFTVCAYGYYNNKISEKIKYLKKNKMLFYD